MRRTKKKKKEEERKEEEVEEKEEEQEEENDSFEIPSLSDVFPSYFLIPMHSSLQSVEFVHGSGMVSFMATGI